MNGKKRINDGKPFTEIHISYNYVDAQQVTDIGKPGDGWLHSIPGTRITMPLPERVQGWTNPSQLKWWLDRAAARSRRLLQETA